LHDLSTGFIARLRSRDPAAWYELWEIFGPILRAQLARWGRGRIGVETVQDLSQETMAALSTAIDRHDPAHGARFSTWLLAIARYTLGDELDRRTAQKRGGGVRPRSLEEGWSRPDAGPSPDAQYEQAVFDAKFEAALRAVEREVGFLDFEVFRQRVLDGRPGKQVARSLGTSEATVSRRLAAVRGLLRERLRETVARFSFTPEELEEPARNGLDLTPKKGEDGAFEEAVADIYHRICQRRAAEGATGSA
jgi:RNA polymerase sigma factor (sigma-70 family)